MDSKNEVVHIVYSTDDGYVMPTFVAAASAFAATKSIDKVIVHILDLGIKDETWKYYAEKLYAKIGGQVLRHKIDPARFEGLRKWHGSVGAYGRLAIPETIDAHWCVYCDGDTLFWDDPLELCKIFDKDKFVQGHLDLPALPTWNGGIPWQSEWYLREGLVWNREEYICTGFILINLAKWRELELTSKCFKFLAEHPTATWPDQDAINWVCRSNKGLLSDRWGGFCSFAFAAEEKPGCIHYSGHAPWKVAKCGYPDFNDAYKKWFVIANKYLGLKLKDVIPNFKDRVVVFRKQILGNCCRLFKVVVPYVFYENTVIGSYLNRHYK